jgi:hypothetical protein
VFRAESGDSRQQMPGSDIGFALAGGAAADHAVVIDMLSDSADRGYEAADLAW